MALPGYEEKDTWTNDEVQHLVAREVMKHRMGDLESKILAHEAATAKVFVDIQSSLTSITQMVGRGTDQIRECRNELKREVEKEFFTQIEATRMESDIKTKIDSLSASVESKISALESKVDKMWIKIVTSLTVVGIIWTALWAVGRALLG